MTDYAATALGLTHFAVGASALISPRFTASIFYLQYHPTSSIIARLFGCRELLVGWNVFSSATPSTSQGLEKKRWAVGFANLMNGIDVISTLMEWIKSDYQDVGAGLGALGAATLLGLGLWSMRYEESKVSRKGL
ncbi:hypothetical protein JCM5350_007752 [Sporobolomyces pararoseus]